MKKGPDGFHIRDVGRRGFGICAHSCNGQGRTEEITVRLDDHGQLQCPQLAAKTRLKLGPLVRGVLGAKQILQAPLVKKPVRGALGEVGKGLQRSLRVAGQCNLYADQVGGIAGFRCPRAQVVANLKKGKDA